MPPSPFIPPVQTALWLGLQQVVARRLAHGRRPTLWQRVAGLACIGAGTSCGALALRDYVRRGTTWHPWAPHHSSSLVTSGPHSLTRNPMYTGLALGLTGTGLLSGTPWTAAASLGLLGSLTPQVKREENALATIFGREWTDYAARVRRWL